MVECCYTCRRRRGNYLRFQQFCVYFSETSTFILQSHHSELLAHFRSKQANAPWWQQYNTTCITTCTVSSNYRFYKTLYVHKAHCIILWGGSLQINKQKCPFSHNVQKIGLNVQQFSSSLRLLHLIYFLLDAMCIKLKY